MIVIRTDVGSYIDVKHYRDTETNELLDDIRAALNTDGVTRLEILIPASEEW